MMAYLGTGIAWWRSILLVVLAMGVALSSCDEEVDGEEEEELRDPDFTMDSKDGIELRLTWEAGPTDSASIANVDMDLRVYRGGVPWKEGVVTDAFETIRMDSSTANATYRVTVEYYKGEINADYTLAIEALEDGTTRTVEGTLGSNDLLDETTMFHVTRVDSLWDFYYPQ